MQFIIQFSIFCIPIFVSGIEDTPGDITPMYIPPIAKSFIARQPMANKDYVKYVLSLWLRRLDIAGNPCAILRSTKYPVAKFVSLATGTVVAKISVRFAGQVEAAYLTFRLLGDDFGRFGDYIECETISRMREMGIEIDDDDSDCSSWCIHRYRVSPASRPPDAPYSGCCLMM
jgi:hypothetical protein